MSDELPPGLVKETANPGNVMDIVESVMRAIKNSINEDTSPSDVLSALFTVLDRTLHSFTKTLSPEEKAYNSQEVGRVLTNLLMEFGTPPSTMMN